MHHSNRKYVTQFVPHSLKYCFVLHLLHVGFPIHKPSSLQIYLEEPSSRALETQETLAVEPNELSVIIALPFGTSGVSSQVISV